MKQFLKDLVNANSPVSSKRFGGLVTLFSTIALAFVAAFKNQWICPEFMYDGLLLVVAGLFGFNMAENIFKKAPVTTAPINTDALNDAPEVPEKPEETPPADKPVVDNPDA